MGRSQVYRHLKWTGCHSQGDTSVNHLRSFGPETRVCFAYLSGLLTKEVVRLKGTGYCKESPRGTVESECHLRAFF